LGPFGAAEAPGAARSRILRGDRGQRRCASATRGVGTSVNSAAPVAGDCAGNRSATAACSAGSRPHPHMGSSANVRVLRSPSLERRGQDVPDVGATSRYLA
jgi:hypothetical protein